MKTLRYLLVVCAVCFVSATYSAAADQMPDYMLKAQSLIAQANSKAAGLNEFSDAVLIGQNYLRRAEAEYKKNLSWGKVEQKAEPTVRYYADMARIQASIVLSQVGKIEQEKEQLRLEGLINEVKAKLKVFDDKTASITTLKGELVKRDSVLAALQATSAEQKKQLENKQLEIDRLTNKVSSLTAALLAAEAKIKGGATELKIGQEATAALGQKLTDVTKNLDASKAETARLRGELAALAAQKGAVESQSQEQIQALKRSQEFLAEVGKLGGVIKTGSDSMTVMFTRSAMIKAPKNDTLTAEGANVVARIAAVLKDYPEFRVKLKVHGFGQPAKNEDPSATDRMARLIREALLVKGKFDPATVEALGAGAVEPIYPKNNPEGNRRVEVTFVKR